MRLFLILLVLLPFTLQAQIQVQIVDAESNEGVSNALIAIDNVNVGRTDQYGHFAIDTVKETISITVKRIGYPDEVADVTPGRRSIVIKLVPNVHQLSEVEISNQMTSQKLRSLAGNYAMLNHNDLLRGNSITIADYFNQVPGVFVQQGALNTNRLTIRGVGSRTPYTTNRIKAYFDEIPLTTGDGSTTLEDIDISGVSRVEVLKGPSSALYGAGLGGVVKYYPLSLGSKNGNINYQSQVGSYGTFKNIVSSAVKLNNFDLTAILGNVYSDGYRQNSRYKRNSMFLFGSRQGKKSNIKILFSVIGVNARIPSSIDQQTFDQNPQAAAKNWLSIKGYEDYTKTMGGLTWTNMLSNYVLSQTTLFVGSLDHYQSRPFNILWENALDYGLRHKFTYTHGTQTWVIGLEWFNEDYTWKIYRTNLGVKGALTSNNKENRNYLNVFLLWSGTFWENLILEAAVNLNTLGYTITDKYADVADHSGHYRYKPVVSPRAGFNYKVSSFINLYSSVGHGFSAPSLQETLLPDGQPNVNLKPEQGYNMDIGARASLLNNRLYLDVTQYWMFLRNLLVTKRVTEEIFTGQNAGSTNHRGIEFTAKYSVILEVPGRKSSVDLSFTLTNADNQFKSFADTSGDYSGKKLPGVPYTSSNLNVTINLQRVFHVYLDFQHIGKQYMTDDNTKSYHAYQLVGLKVAYNLPFRKCLFNIYAGVQNLLNENYASMILVNAPSLGTASPRYYYPGNPRSFFAGIVIGLGK